MLNIWEGPRVGEQDRTVIEHMHDFQGKLGTTDFGGEDFGRALLGWAMLCTGGQT